jgi:CRP/FNR family transcriptional regulator
MGRMSPLVAAVFQDIPPKPYTKGQIVLHQGHPVSEVLVLRAGIIRMYDINEQGTEKIVHLLKPGAILPLAFFSGNKSTTQWFYAALTDCEVCAVPFQKLTARMQVEPKLATLLINWFSAEVLELLVRLSSPVKTNTRGKLLAALKFLAMHHAVEQQNSWWQVSFPVNHQLLAEMTGMIRESAAAGMKHLQDEGIVRYARLTILEINLAKLEKLS